MTWEGQIDVEALRAGLVLLCFEKKAAVRISGCEINQQSVW